MAGPQFEPSTDVLRILAVALFPSFVFGVWGFALLSLGRYRSLLIANGVALLASAAITLALGTDYGADGAAFATLLGDACLAVGSAIVLMCGHREFRVSLELLPRVALAVGLAATVLLIPGCSGDRSLTLAVVIYIAAVVVLRAVPEEIPSAAFPAAGGVMAAERILVVRGHLVNPWELQPWALLPERFDVACLLTGSNVFDTADVPLPQIRVRARRDLLPRGPPRRRGDGSFGRSLPATPTTSSREPTSSTPPSSRSGSRARRRG